LGKSFLVAAALVLAVAGEARADQAEPGQGDFVTYVSVYGGAVYVPNTDIDIDEERFEDRHFDVDRLFGGRVGWWAKTLSWVAWEVNVWNSWTGTDFLDLDLILVNFSGSFLLQHFFGPVRAYGGGGIVGTWAELTNSADQDSLAPGALAQAGAEYSLPVAPEWGAFAEFRFTWNAFMFEDDTLGKVDINPSRMEFLGGVSYRF
jgi:hypothetical protein